jgi:hypothetical protein
MSASGSLEGTCSPGSWRGCMQVRGAPIRRVRLTSLASVGAEQREPPRTAPSPHRTNVTTTARPAAVRSAQHSKSSCAASVGKHGCLLLLAQGTLALVTLRRCVHHMGA